MEGAAPGGGGGGPPPAAPPPSAAPPTAPAALYPQPEAAHEELLADPALFMRLLQQLHAQLAGAPQPPKSKAPSKFRVPVGARRGPPPRPADLGMGSGGRARRRRLHAQA
jgi:hypothetical protein